MATYGTAVRRGLPRRPGGDAWPPAGAAPVDDKTLADLAESAAVTPVAATVAESVAPALEDPNTVPDASAPPIPAPDVVAPEPANTPPSASGVAQSSAQPNATAESAVAAAPDSGAATVRRGLPRVRGGEPWPPADFAAAATPAALAPQSPSVRASADAPQELIAEASTRSVPQTVSAATVAAAHEPTAEATAPRASAPARATEAVTVRRGLPRVPGGEPWPPADFAAAVPVASAEAAPPAVSAETTTLGTPAETIVVEQVATDGAVSTEVVAVEASGVDVSVPLPFTKTVWQGDAARRFEAEQRAQVKLATPEPRRIGPFTRLQCAGIVVVGGGGLLYAAALAVVLVRWLLSTEWGVDFIATYPGEYHLPEGAPVGLPAWLGWQHFFNAFLIVLIIRSGLQVRTEKRPTAFWSPRGNPRRKISLNLWFHQSLDILWIVNGVVFVVLLFVTGQWMRIVPTSWEVFPNAVSAILQYISLDWPTENGWVNYNSIQQIAYFTTVFIAAPLAIVTGVRMSGIWPKDAKALNKAYPVEWARAVHFPTMLYFVAFIAVHVFLVFATGALRNLNHMYAAQGSTDPNAYADNWAGFWWFFASLVVIAAAWIAARPLVLAPIAKLFGNVSGR